MVVIGNSTFGAPAVDVEEAVLSFKEAAVTGVLGSCCPSRETDRPQRRKRVCVEEPANWSTFFWAPTITPFEACVL